MNGKIAQYMVFAFSALAFHITLSVSLIVLGTPGVQMATMLALLFGGVSQFLAQSEYEGVQGAGLASSFGSVAFLLLALFLMAIGA